MFAKLAHLHYPLPLTTDDAGYLHRFAAIPDVSRTREAGLAWIDRAQWLGEMQCCIPFPPLPAVSSARPLNEASTEVDDLEFNKNRELVHHRGAWRRRTDSNRISEGQSLFRSLISTHLVGSGGEIRTLARGLRTRSVPCTHRDWLAPRSGIEPNTTRFGISSMPSTRGGVWRKAVNSNHNRVSDQVG